MTVSSVDNTTVSIGYLVAAVVPTAVVPSSVYCLEISDKIAILPKLTLVTAPPTTVL